MPEEGVEPTLSKRELDFESSASANFATPAREKRLYHIPETPTRILKAGREQLTFIFRI